MIFYVSVMWLAAWDHLHFEFKNTMTLQTAKITNWSSISRMNQNRSDTRHQRTPVAFPCPFPDRSDIFGAHWRTRPVFLNHCAVRNYQVCRGTLSGSTWLAIGVTGRAIRFSSTRGEKNSIADSSGGNELSRRVSVTLRDDVRSTAIKEPIEVTRMPPR